MPFRRPFSSRRLGRTPSVAAPLALTALVVALVAALAAAAVAPPASEADAEPTEPKYDVPEKPLTDPVATNGKIFVDWPKPRLAMLFTGELDGYIEPCGCAGLENQKGGLKRRHSLIKQLEGDGWPLVKLDVGGLTKRLGPQTETKLCQIVEALATMRYDAVGVGANELRLNVDAVAYALSNVDPARNPMVSANVGIYSLDSGMTQAYRVVQAGGKRVGVTSVLGAEHVAALKNVQYILLGDPATELAKVAPKLAAEKCDFQVLLVHGKPEEATALSQKFPQFQLVMAAGGADEPPATPKTIPGSGASLIEAGHKGMYAIVLGVFDDPKQPFRFQRVPLDSRFADSPEMQAVLVAYQKQLETLGLDGLGLSGNPHPDGEFAGTAVCGDCHTKAMEVWEKTPHAHATDTLVKLVPPRHFDPECLSCHVTGWNPQEYFPYSSGFFGVDSTPDLMQNGCENCHGPGKAHADAELGEVEVTAQEQQALRDALKMKIVVNEGNKDGQEFSAGKVVKKCIACHDIDNSPEFDFQKYWEYVKHEGKD
jgi:hypothetical protein